MHMCFSAPPFRKPNPTILWSDFGLEYGRPLNRLSARWFRVRPPRQPLIVYLCVKVEDAEYPGPHCMILGGYSQLNEALAKELTVHFETKVTAIMHSEEVP